MPRPRKITKPSPDGFFFADYVRERTDRMAAVGDSLHCDTPRRCLQVTVQLLQRIDNY